MAGLLHTVSVLALTFCCSSWYLLGVPCGQPLLIPCLLLETQCVDTLAGERLGPYWEKNVLIWLLDSSSYKVYPVKHWKFPQEFSRPSFFCPDYIVHPP